MASKGSRKIRRGQTITPYGVGAILDISGQSFVAADTSAWQHEPQIIEDAELVAEILGVDYLQTAPEFSETENNGVNFVRFPQELFCAEPTCRRITNWSKYLKGLTPNKRKQVEKVGFPYCPHCDNKEKKLIPMRFIQVCGKGHMEDISWFEFAHGDSQGCGTKTDQNLVFKSEQQGSSGGLNTLYVQCNTCQAKKYFTGLEQWRRTCYGKHPWLAGTEDCFEEEDPEKRIKMKVTQRGASNVHFPEIFSLLDIQEESNDLENPDHIGSIIRDNDLFKALVTWERNLTHIPDLNSRDEMITNVARTIIQEHHLNESIEIAELKPKIEEELSKKLTTNSNEKSMEDIQREEWTVLQKKGADGTGLNQDQLKTEHVSLDAFQSDEPLQILSSKFDSLIKVKQLREIRALKGFYRLTMDKLVPANINEPDKDMPAVDVHGEGIFFSLDETILKEWEKQPDVKLRSTELEARRKESFFHRIVPKLTPRFLLIHTLSHLLIRELMYGSGYDGSAIQERIYVSGDEDESPMAGLLLYTTDGDSSGTLGGLVRLGSSDLFFPLLGQALTKAQWCSFDPVCKESEEQGVDGLSKAACHACSLIGETSCRAHNSGLDRNLLIGSEYGYFRDVIN